MLFNVSLLEKNHQPCRDYQIICYTFCIFWLISTGITNPHTVFLQDPGGKEYISPSFNFMNRRKINNTIAICLGKKNPWIIYITSFFTICATVERVFPPTPRRHNIAFRHKCRTYDVMSMKYSIYTPILFDACVLD